MARTPRPTSANDWKAKVELSGPLFEGDVEKKVKRNIREMLEKLAEAYPELRPMLRKGVTVAVNGEVYHGAFLTPIAEGSEVFLLPAMQGERAGHPGHERPQWLASELSV